MVSREEFIRQLRENLTKLPKEELESAVTYYEEYFEEAGIENEAQILQELGSPILIAKQIMADFAIKEAEVAPKSTKTGIWTIWIVVLAILASPIALPLAVAALAIVFAVFVTIGSLIFAGGVVVVSLIGAGILVLGLTFKLIFIDTMTSIFFLGGAMILIGGGILGILLVYWLIGKVVPLMVKVISSLFSHTKKGVVR